MSSIGAAPGAAFVSSARAEASRINGAKSRGPKTPEGKARSSQNALKHGFRAERFTVVGDEDEDAYDAHERALLDELAPEGALQALLAERIARAAWRLARADCIEATLFDRLADTDGDLGMAVIRDGHGGRAFQTLLRYRGAAQAELWRALRMLKALQAEQAQRREAGPELLVPARHEKPSEPEARRIPGEAHGSIGPRPTADEAEVSGRADAEPSRQPARPRPAHPARPGPPVVAAELAGRGPADPERAGRRVRARAMGTAAVV